MAGSGGNKIPFLLRSSMREILFCAAISLPALLPLSPAGQHFPFRDSGVFLFTGWRMLAGEVPYADVWDHKPPLVYFINAAGLALGGGSVWGVWLLEWISLFTACLLAFRLLKRTFGDWASGMSLALMLAAFSVLVLGGNFTTEYALPFQFAVLTLIAGARAEGPDLRRLFGIGFLGACLFLLKQNLIVIPAAAIAFRLGWLWRTGSKRSIPPEAGAALAGLATAVLPVAGYFAAHGALADAWDAAFRFNIYYAETGVAACITSLFHGVESVAQAGFGVLGLAGWSAATWLLARRDEIFRRDNAWLVLAFVALPAELLAAALPGRFEIHYYLGVLPVFCVFAALGLWAVLRGSGFQEASFRLRLPAAALFIGLLISTSSVALVERVGSYRTNDWSDVAAYVAANTPASDTVLFWGAEAGLNFATRRLSPTRYVYLYPLYVRGYISEEEITSFYRSLKNSPPLWIIDTKNPWTPFLDIPGGAAEKAGFLEWFQTHYSKTVEIHGWTFYRKITA